MTGSGTTRVDPADLGRAIRSKALSLGFERVGFSNAAVPDEARHFERWLDAGMHAGMRWMETSRTRRLEPATVLEGVRSLIVVALSYDSPGAPEPAAPEGGIVARYARVQDYHQVMGERLTELEAFIESRAPGHRARAYVDTGAILERMWAARAGIGWVGKNSLILNKDMGSFFFLGVVLTTVRLPPDQPATDQCGACTLCIEACPTQAIVEPRIVDSRRCISYHTIELRGDIPDAYRVPLGTRVFGCDACQEACPWNAPTAARSLPEAFTPREDWSSPSLTDLLTLSHTSYLERFRGSAIKRATYQGLKRNAAIALGNRLAARSGDARARRDAIAELSAVAADKKEPVSLRRHAAWALRRASNSFSRR
ncbi:MAG: tRNA epoxyqueuosine(34) reductase QueG [Acidobacteriota bacterium]